MLQLLISPFILRRKKEEVARELPPLTEHVVFCHVAEEQEKLDEEAKTVIRNAILENIDKDGIKKSSFVVLQGLTKLRQLANRPSLHDKESEEVSVKFEQMLSMLENLVAENQKVLIFSSFVTHLQLIEERIKQQKNVFVYRFITENSIEEKIQVSKERKNSLADKFINSNNPFAEIIREEIVELLK